MHSDLISSFLPSPSCRSRAKRRQGGNNRTAWLRSLIFCSSLFCLDYVKPQHFSSDYFFCYFYFASLLNFWWWCIKISWGYLPLTAYNLIPFLLLWEEIKQPNDGPANFDMFWFEKVSTREHLNCWGNLLEILFENSSCSEASQWGEKRVFFCNGKGKRLNSAPATSLALVDLASCPVLQ